ncbi:hypothetical protein SISSUDRAFT_1031171 [Sistotremastrum suecicum HHB10207 ss-3]|uniref:Letm1 RBD domain-containing protein n=1 Tax=Sistotremastrum suecicum HHB10207 ss-3 TaxID=1314776 RepID=A0A166G950_9AGAM|nr:hypothetical protein SISSUDRAFT_1031171 [Sistotremastrum suecicum HHB10207 ss-3]
MAVDHAKHGKPLGPIDMAKEDIQNAVEHGILMPPPPNASLPRRLFHQAKELFKFYWSGLKMIFSNRKHANLILSRAREAGRPLTRWETRFIATSHADTVKLIPFVLVLLILEEALPFFVLYAPFLLPSTCLLVSQRLRIAEQGAKKRLEYVRANYEILRPLADASSSPDSAGWKAICSTLSLSKIGPQALLKRRVSTHLSSVKADDALLIFEAGGNPAGIAANLSEEELRQVLVERGFITSNVPTAQMAKEVEWWFNQLHDPSMDRIPLVAQAALRTSRSGLSS